MEFQRCSEYCQQDWNKYKASQGNCFESDHVQLAHCVTVIKSPNHSRLQFPQL